MATLQSLGAFKAAIGYGQSDRDTVYAALLEAVSDAVVRRLRNPIASATYTEYYDAPLTDTLVLRQRPVTAVTSVLYHAGSNGDPSLFDATADALAQYSDWLLEVDQPDGSSRCGILRRTSSSAWGVRPRRPVGRLANRLDPDRRAVKVTYTAGYSPVPPSLLKAINLMTARLYLMMPDGVPLTSESWNGYTKTPWLQAMADGLLDAKDVWPLLLPFSDVSVGSR